MLWSLWRIIFGNLSNIFVLFLNLNIMADDPVLLQLVRKDMDLNEHERISNITLRHKLR